MTYVSSSVPNLINGISQQPSAFKLATQAEHQLNGVSSVVKGLKKRPPTVHKAKIAGSSLALNSFVHTLDYGLGEFYTVVINDSTINVYDSEGEAVVLEALTATATAYLTGLSNPSQELVATTIADQTYIINKNTTVAKGTAKTASRPYEGLVYVKNGDYKTEYKVVVTVGTTAYTTTYTTRDSSDVAHEPDVQTTNIIENLYGSLSLPSGVNKSMEGNTIRVYSDTQDFTLKATDDRGGTHMFHYKGQEADFKKLPAEGPLGFKIRVVGNNEKQQDDYYVQLEDPEGNGKPVWKETTADDIEYQIDNATMPHALVKEPDGSFHFKELEWDDRKVGDEDTNPYPSFIGQTLNDLFFYRNRLGLLSGENVILSEVGSFWNFFHTTTLVLSDAAVIDISVSTSKTNELKYAVPFNAALMLFSDTTQFTLDSGQVLAHDTVAVEVSTRFEADLRCKPVGSSTFVFFATTRGDFGGLREYYVADDSDANDAENVTSHVPEFIEGGVQSISASSTEDMLVLRASGKPNELYVYNYFWANKEKKQSAWHKWDLGAEILSAEFSNSKLILIVNRPTGPCIETINLSLDEENSTMDYGHGLLLDRRCKVDVNNPVSALPYGATETPMYYNQKGGYLGSSLSPSLVADYLQAGDTLYTGFTYPFEYRFAEFLLRSEGRPIVPTKLTLKTLSIEYDRTASFDIWIYPTDSLNSTRQPYNKTFAPTLGGSNTLLSQVSVDSGKFKVPVWGDSRTLRATIENNSPFPCTFQTAEWTATYSKHAKAT